MKILYVFSCLLLTFCSSSHASEALKKLYSLPSSAVLLVDESNEEVIARQPNKPFIPASTVKLITAIAALEYWGNQHRFKTEFYLDRKHNVLIVKGLGDPFLVSEELDIIVEKIKRLNILDLDGIVADTSYFDSVVNIEEQGKSNNPYDAASSALAVNFNSIEVDVDSGIVTSAETQTPLTPMAKKLASKLANGRHRINLGSAERSPDYFIEVLVEKLQTAGIDMSRGEKTVRADINNAQLLFIHSNTRTLNEVVAAMLEYSNNFIANQLFLLLGAEQLGAPANLDKSQQVISNFIAEHFDWQNYVIEDGAGLSRANRLTAKQLIEVLRLFREHKQLMPQQTPHILAKSGTLKGVSCYAGYVFRNHEWQTFALLINQPVRYRFREQVAEDLLRY